MISHDHLHTVRFFCWSFLFKIANITLNHPNPNKHSWAYNPTDQLRQEDCADPGILVSEHGLLTPGWELFGVDYFGSVFLACAQLDTTSHDWKSSPEKKTKKQDKVKNILLHKKKKKTQCALTVHLGEKLQIKIRVCFLRNHKRRVPYHQINFWWHISVQAHQRANQIYWYPDF